ncbi:MAG TPA: hypothetical protein VEX15_01350 [Nocardioidaceae bacterium]|nr:hypothetical protein [Nocardioidaceae bacterium]
MSEAKDDDGLAKDLEAVVEARRELDSTYEPALVESFLERVDAAVEKRVEAELKARDRDDKGWLDKEHVYATMGLSIPITVVAGIFGDVYGIAVVWAGIVGLNLAGAWGDARRRRRRDR